VIKTLLKFILPLLVLGLGVFAVSKMIAMKPVVETREPELPDPVVRVIEVQPQNFRFTVLAQGNVVPRTETTVVPEVSGRVVYVYPSLAAGGFFEAGTTLLGIDPRDYELAMVGARAEVARAQVTLETEKAQAEVALKEWQSLGQGEASSLLRREPQLAQARAFLESAHAALEQARRNLEKTEIKAPFAGRVRQKNVDIGQFVTIGAPVATIYSVDFAEVRLPLPDKELAYLNLPLSYRGDRDKKKGPGVVLRATFGGKEYSWQGRIVRTEGVIDPQTRMIHVVAQVENPYGRGRNPGRPPLAVGMFVEAEIMGKLSRDVFLLPRNALRGKDRILVVDSEQRLHFRNISVLRTNRDQVIVESGLEAGELVSLAALDTVVDGMKVRVLEEKEISEPAADAISKPVVKVTQ